MPDIDIQPPPEGKPVNRWREAKRTGKVGLVLAGAGVQVAQYATGASTIALLTAAGAASATGIGLVVTGAALTLTSAVLSGRAAIKTGVHLDNLKKIQSRVNCYACMPIDAKLPEKVEHRVIVEGVLPYIIQQKSTKYKRKWAGAVPVVGLLETVRAVGKKAYKKFWTHDLGQKRERAAKWLAWHLITHNCGLAQAIVAELYSFQEMLWIKDQDFRDVKKLIEDKIKST
ncbi:MAG TPA: hypothetical protein VMF08_07795 [Candidatus Sulfotelmatobacter sp.]|nr:hypothetical protein [Candidatus Sulfotelmatobacter sp.]